MFKQSSQRTKSGWDPCGREAFQRYFYGTDSVTDSILLVEDLNQCLQ